jgi:hypothetical protein
VIKQISELGLAGGVVYDALIARVAQKSKAERLLTLFLILVEGVLECKEKLDSHL